MKVEIKMSETEKSHENVVQSSEILSPSCEVAIDIGQILAANQALLKNMARRMESLETKLGAMEKAYAEQTLMLCRQQKSFALLEASKPDIKPWQPEQPSLDNQYFSRFSFFDRVFRPWKMRRDNLND